MAVSKVILNGTTLIDVTTDTVTSSTLLSNYTATDASGSKISGAYSGVVLQSKTATPTESIQTILPDSGYALSQVTVYGISSSYVGSGVPTLSSQAFTPATTAQTISAGRYLAGDQTIEPIPSAYLIPTGTLNITSNGTYNVSSYASANVSVSGGGGGETSTHTAFIEYIEASAWGNSHVVYNDIAYSNEDPDAPASFTFTAGDTLYCYAWDDDGAGYCHIYLDGVEVGEATAGKTKRFEYTLPSGDIYLVLKPSHMEVYSEGNSKDEALVTRKVVAYTHNTLSNVGTLAFAGCSNLYSVDFASCTSIGSSAFSGCTALTNISFPNCTIIGDGAFFGCSSLQAVSFPSCTSIGSAAFSGCTYLVSVSFPSCETIGSGAFSGCIRLYSVSFPECTTIYATAFAYCSSLTFFKAPECTSIGISAFISCSIQSISMSKCNSIGMYAFASCQYLGSASFATCTTIGARAFANCSALADIDFPACTFIGSYAFTSCSHNGFRYASFSLCQTIGSYAFNSCRYLYSASFPACSMIYSYAFLGCSNLYWTYFPSCVTVGEGAFANCTSLRHIDLPSCTLVSGSAFRSCYSLSAISLPLCSRIAGSSAFAACTSLQSIYMPRCISIGSGAFCLASSMSNAVFGNSGSVSTGYSIYQSAFASCYILSSLYLLASAMYNLGNVNVFASTPISNYVELNGGNYGSVFVPASLYDGYISATNWATYSARIVSMTDAEIEAFLSNYS